MNLANAYERLDQNDKAAEAYKTIIANAPKYLPAFNNLAWVYAKDNKRLDEALEYAKKAAAFNPNDPNVKDTLGWIYYLKGEYQKALENLLLSVKAINNHPSIHYHLGATYQKLGRLKEAQEALEKALSLKTDFPEKSDTEIALKELKKK